MRILFFQDEAGLLKQVCLSRLFGAFFVNWLKEKMPFRNDSSYALLPNDWLRKIPD